MLGRVRVRQCVDLRRVRERIVDLDERVPLIRERVLRKDRLHRALGLARAAILSRDAAGQCELVLPGNDSAERVCVIRLLRVDAHHAPERLPRREIEPTNGSAAHAEVRHHRRLLARSDRDVAGDRRSPLEPRERLLVMYDSHHPSMESYFNRFPARQYNLKSDQKELFLRFSACFGQFLMAKDFQISYKNLPLKLYELTRYSFRREKSGELVGLRRLRAFSMPDCHAFCKDMEQSKIEFMKRIANLSISVIEEIGLSLSTDLEMAIRFTEEFYLNNKEFIKQICQKVNKPILVEMWKERFFYFVLKWEFNYVDNLGKASALSTDQIDIENGLRYGITFIDENGDKQNPIILHNSPSGAIERVIFALLEKSAKLMKQGKTPFLPLWLMNTQIRLIPVNENFHCKMYRDK